MMRRILWISRKFGPIRRIQYPISDGAQFPVGIGLRVRFLPSVSAGRPMGARDGMFRGHSETGRAAMAITRRPPQSRIEVNLRLLPQTLGSARANRK